MASGTRTPRPVLVRQRLVQRVIGAGAAPVAVLQGPAGLGKSVLLGHVADHARRSRVTWVVSPDELIAYARRPPGKGHGSVTDLLLVDGIDDADDDLVRAVVRSAARGSTRMVIAARIPLAGVTPGMVLDGGAVIVTTEELLLTLEEVTTLAARMKVDLEPDEVAELHLETDGWPAIVEATLRSCPSDASVADRRLHQTIDTYVREEVLGALPSDHRAMLTQVAAIPRFDIPVLAALLADLGPEADPVHVIDSWAAAGWILHDPLQGHWRIPRPMRQSLLTDLDAKRPGRRVELTTRAAQTLVAAGRTTDALPYLVEASLDDVVAGVLRDRWGDDVAPRGQFVDTRPAVDSLSDSALASDPSLLLIAAVSALRAPPDLDTFALRLSQAEAVIDRGSFNGPLMTFHTLSMLLARGRGDIDRANAIERSAQAHIDAATDKQRHEHVNRIAYFHLQVGISRLAEGQLQDASTALRSARSIARHNGGDWYVAVDEEKLAYVSFLRGDLTAARQETESARAYAQARSDPLIIKHVHLLHGLLELEHGRTWDVPSKLSRAQTMLDHDAEPPASLLALAWSVLGLMTRDPSAAEQAMLLCSPDYATNRLPFDRFLATIARAHARLVHDDPKAALSELDMIGPPPGHAALARVTRARAYLALGEPPAAARELTPYDDTDEPLPLTVRADLLALAVECALRQDRDAHVPFGRLLALLERTGARRPVLLLPDMCEAVLTGQLSAPASSPLSSMNVEVAALVRANRDGVPQLSERELEVLTALAGSSVTLTDIARSMYVSGNTLKTITRGLYRKLGAADRHEAVHIALVLGVLPARPGQPIS